MTGTGTATVPALGVFAQAAPAAAAPLAVVTTTTITTGMPPGTTPTPPLTSTAHDVWTTMKTTAAVVTTRMDGRNSIGTSPAPTSHPSCRCSSQKSVGQGPSGPWTPGPPGPLALGGRVPSNTPSTRKRRLPGDRTTRTATTMAVTGEAVAGDRHPAGAAVCRLPGPGLPCAVPRRGSTPTKTHHPPARPAG